jgi:hypothetical protein
MKTPSDQLLLDCLRLDGSGPPIERLIDLPINEWEDLLAAAGRHSLLPLLYHTLKPVLEKIDPPSEVLEKMKRIYLASAARNMRLYHELGQVLKGCSEATIPVILLKGAHLAEFVYKDIALRPMSDIDILVEKSHLGRMKDVLIALGYIMSREEMGQSQEHLAPFRKQGATSIEVHYHIAVPPISLWIDIGKLSERARSVKLEGIEATTLAPNDLLLHLCLHASIHHGFDNGVRPLFDIAYMIERYHGEIDWEDLIDIGQRWHLDRVLSIMLDLTIKITGATIPDRMLDALAVRADSSERMITAENLLFEEFLCVEPNVARLFESPRWVDKMALLSGRIFPSRREMGITDPGATSLTALTFAYGFRAKGLLKHHSRSIWRLLFHDREALKSVEVENQRNALKDWLIAGDR